jgi:hypothetical protein
MDRLHVVVSIFDPKSKAKLVAVSCKASSDSRELFEKHFGKKKP